MVNGGDSGSPCWIGVREPGNSHATLVPIGITTNGGTIASSLLLGSTWRVQYAVDQLNASGAYAVQTVDLSGFTSYP